MGKLAQVATKAGASLSFPCSVTFENGTTKSFDDERSLEKACARGEFVYRNGGFFSAALKDRRAKRHGGGPKPLAAAKPKSSRSRSARNAPKEEAAPEQN